VKRGEHQERARLTGRNQLASKLARKVKTCIDIDSTHPLPGLCGHRQRVVGFVPLRGRAVHEVRDLPDGRLCGSQQIVACAAAR
jgi:hypothetical protein